MFALTPSLLVTSVNLGSLVKLNPSEITFTFAILPFSAFEDFVLYDNRSHSDEL